MPAEPCEWRSSFDTHWRQHLGGTKSLEFLLDPSLRHCMRSNLQLDVPAPSLSPSPNRERTSAVSQQTLACRPTLFTVKNDIEHHRSRSQLDRLEIIEKVCEKWTLRANLLCTSRGRSAYCYGTSKQVHSIIYCSTSWSGGGGAERPTSATVLCS